MSLISSVDIYKGPSSSVYGAGLGGAIHITPHESEKPGWSTRVGVGAGSFGLKRTNLSITKAREEGYFTIGGQPSDGYRGNNNYNRSGIQLSGSQKYGTISVIFFRILRSPIFRDTQLS